MPPPPRPTREPGLIHLGRRVVWSFAYAGIGIAYFFRTTRNARLQLGLAMIALAMAAWLRLPAAEWAIIVLTIAVVLACECVNTAIEASVDLASPDIQPLAKIAKDVAAGAVLIASAGAAVVGAILFLPRLWHRFMG